MAEDPLVSILDTPVAGLPLDAWLLLAVAVGVGLGLELAFWRARRRDVTRDPVDGRSDAVRAERGHDADDDVTRSGGQ